jgi:hypothetical protein
MTKRQISESITALEKRIQRLKEMNASDGYRDNLTDGEEARDEIFYWFIEEVGPQYVEKLFHNPRKLEGFVRWAQETFPGCSGQFVEDVISDAIDGLYYDKQKDDYLKKLEQKKKGLIS